MTVAAAAGLVAMAARFSDDLGDAAGIAARADALRAQAAMLADEDAQAYAAVLEAYRIPREPDPAARGSRISDALAVAADVPLGIVACARDVGELAVRLAEEGNPNLRGDAVTGLHLAEAAARSATYLVQTNVTLGGLDGHRMQQAEEWCASLRQAQRRAGGSA